jgi:hypothetical protein
MIVAIMLIIKSSKLVPLIDSFDARTETLISLMACPFPQSPVAVASVAQTCVILQESYEEKCDYQRLL